MKISDYIMQFIHGLGVDHVFYVSGGGAMHMNDSLGRSEMTGVPMLFEQGAAIAAEGYARVRDGYGCCLVTSGPGATNAVTGCVGAFIDSIPLIFLSGQAKRADLRGDSGVRQFGIQEADIISIVQSYTKYAVQIAEPEDIRYELEKAAALAVNGRPGPVWLDVPLDIQASEAEPASLRGFDETLPSYDVKDDDLQECIRLFNQAERPVLMLGHGIRLAHAIPEARQLVELLGAPVLTTWNGVDLLEDDHPLYFGRPGGVGQRAANLIQQNADFVLTIGTRLNLLATGYNFDSFLAKAKHVMVDIDRAEMEKKSVHPDLKIQADAGSFIRGLLSRKNELDLRPRAAWLTRCRALSERFPVTIPDQDPREGYVSNYRLIEEISRQMTGEDIYQFTSSGTAVDIAMKVFRIKKGQRAFLGKGLAAMGYDIPESIGSCIGSGGRRVVCVTGDGGACMNMQELEVIHRLNLPVKLFISDNSGYAMIYGSQFGNFKGRLTGCTKESGLTLPDLKKVAEAFGIKGMHIETEERLAEQVREALSYDGPVVTTVRTDITQKVLPKQANYLGEDGQMHSRPIDDMVPLLDREEYQKITGGEAL